MGCRYCGNCGPFSDGLNDAAKLRRGCFRDDLQGDTYRMGCPTFLYMVATDAVLDALSGLGEALGITRASDGRAASAASADEPACECADMCVAIGDLPRSFRGRRGCNTEGDEGRTQRADHCKYYRSTMLAGACEDSRQQPDAAQQ